MNGHEGERSRVEAMQLGMEHSPTAHASTTNPTSSLVHCAQIKITEKLSTKNHGCSMEAPSGERQTELEFAVRMGELKVLFLPHPSCIKKNLERA
ncbi:hypothetical protein TNIN_283611 [Trichonephila inaurata madagascariensis]|uniref:Uncharacterized protein n=1 Tax=Trichonephila inaurata madagascariensis TaxID=2747483 RepID=A0A8X6XBV8_9ARAC|nr:hypothetical protein TNIN_283611 [Trichonephila inaurata madagascariensis]